MRAYVSTLILFFMSSSPMFAQAEISVYSNGRTLSQSTLNSTNSISAGVIDIVSGLGLGSVANPAQYGLRLTWWKDSSRGVGLSFDHAPQGANSALPSAISLSPLGSGGGLNLVSVNAYRRWQDTGLLTPYVGAGVGVSLPKVEIDSGSGRTSRLQIGGPALQWVAGARIPLTDKLSVFGEYSGSFSMNSAGLSGAGQIDGQTQNNALNFGLSLGF